MEDPADASDLPHVNLVFIGPCGCGKSTTAGRLIADSCAIDRSDLDRVEQEATARGQNDRCYAWILDKLHCERERGGTMYVALWRLSSRRCRFTVIDAPGHADFSKDAVTAMSQADVAVLVVAAAQEELPDGCEREGQVREHTLLAYTLGLRQLVVCVNKMDSESVGYSEEQFEQTCERVREDLDKSGLKTHDVYFDVHFVPTSGLRGDNIMDRSDHMDWYCGPTLVEALDDAVASHFKPERPLRFPLREVMKIGGTGVVAVGRVATGSLRAGASLLFAPGGVRAEVRSITMHHETLEEATCGDVVNLAVDVAENALRSGMVGALVDDSPARECSSFIAQVIVLSPPRAGDICAGCTLWVSCHSSSVPCVFEDLKTRTDRRTGKVLMQAPPALRAGDAAVVRLRPLAPLCVEPFSEYPPLGRFSVNDQKVTVALGVVQQVEYDAEQPRGAARKGTPTGSRGLKSHAPKGKTAKPHLAKKACAMAPLPSGDCFGASALHFMSDSGEEQSAAARASCKAPQVAGSPLRAQGFSAPSSVLLEAAARAAARGGPEGASPGESDGGGG